MDPAPGAAPIVDCHAHVFTRDLPLVGDAWMAPDYDYTAHDYLAELDRHGVHFGVLSGLSISGFYNDYTIASARLSPRLRATAIVAPDTDPYVLRRMRDDGVVGIRFQLARRTALPDFSDEAHRLLLRRVRDLDWHVHVAIEGERLPPVLAALEQSGVRIVLDHFGHPEPARGLACTGFQAALEAVERGRIWIKLSGGFRLAGTEAWRNPDIADAEAIAETAAAALLAQAGPERLLWGSDAPFVGYERRMSYERALAQLARWVPDPATRRALSDTALRFYFS
ncbi:amidohydrolase family protein [Sphingomonas sp. RT2P30]|uniref:amidohydrolase family protein n=1 Tax=Parasphingomonas halimpatiens TaxID=3096162 RepID=UPI002FCC7125